MNDQIIATYSATWHLYPFLPAAYMSFLDHHPNARVFVFINDEKVPAPQFAVTEDMLKEGVKIRKGKKVFHKAILA